VRRFISKFAGIWRHEKTHAPARFVIQNGVSRFSGARLVPMGGGQFVAGDSQLKFTLDKDGKPMSAEFVDSDGEVSRFAPGAAVDTNARGPRII
jgi:hypothetical protein